MPGHRRTRVSREIRDIRFPTSYVPEGPEAAEPPLRTIRPVPTPPRQPIRARKHFPKRPFAAFLLVAFLVASAGGVFWYRQKVAQAERLREVLAKAGHAAPVDFLGLGADLPTSLDGWMSFLKRTFSFYGSFGRASLDGLGALDTATQLFEELPGMIFRREGGRLAEALAALQGDLDSLASSLESLNGKESEVEKTFPGLSEYLGYAPDVRRGSEAIGAFLDLLRSPGQHHVLVLLGNTAELRPGGGFLGSFADLPLGNGEIGELTVHDVNETDRGFEASVVPPQPVQEVARRWRAADANWFFDYPQSARQTLDFMSRSSFYAARDGGPHSLDAAILISPQVIQDLLRATGPLELADGTTANAETVIPMIQREVQAGQASGDAAPKRILSELVPPLKDALQDLDETAWDGLLGSAEAWIKNKDLLMYFRDPDLARLAAYYGVDGGLYATPEKFEGDYLAVVNANLGGGKSDAFMSDAIDFESHLREDGAILNRVTLTRANDAGADEEWWYRVPNQNYLQVFVPQGAELSAATGGTARSVVPRADYSSGFEVDPGLKALESTLRPVPGVPGVTESRQSGKDVFATWMRTPPGARTTLAFEYRRDLERPFRDGESYLFVYERQSGAKQSLQITLHAPPGFVWKENDAVQYVYRAPRTPGRITLPLTLEKI